MRAKQATCSGADRGALAAMIGALRDLARSATFFVGALALYHRLRNRQTLTVVTLHRVLRRGDPRWETTLPPWTLADDVFDKCLAFFKRHYSLVTLGDVKASIERTRPLPSRSLLITFDDGFADNFDYALPRLQKHSASAVVFITTDVIGREERLWTEDLLWASGAGRISRQQVACLHTRLIGECPHDLEDAELIWDLVRRGPQLKEAQVHAALSMLGIELCRIKQPRQMLTRDEIAKLAISELSIGAHGKSHTALPFSSDIATELCRPRAILTDILTDIVACHGQGSVQDSVDAMSFPHGAYTSELIDQALDAGYKLVFTGDAELCGLERGLLKSPKVGRVDIDGRRLAPNGKFRPDVLAATLFTARLRPATQPSRGVSHGPGRSLGTYAGAEADASLGNPLSQRLDEPMEILASARKQKSQ